MEPGSTLCPSSKTDEMSIRRLNDEHGMRDSPVGSREKTDSTRQNPGHYPCARYRALGSRLPVRVSVDELSSIPAKEGGSGQLQTKTGGNVVDRLQDLA